MHWVSNSNGACISYPHEQHKMYDYLKTCFVFTEERSQRIVEGMNGDGKMFQCKHMHMDIILRSKKEIETEQTSCAPRQVQYTHIQPKAI